MRINPADRRIADAMMERLDLTLAQLGWRPFFSEQVSSEESPGTGDDDWLISTSGRWSPNVNDYGPNAV